MIWNIANLIVSILGALNLWLVVNGRHGGAMFAIIAVLLILRAGRYAIKIQEARRQ